MSFFFFFNDTATTEIYTLSLHDALPISLGNPAFMRDPEHMRQVRIQRRDFLADSGIVLVRPGDQKARARGPHQGRERSEEHTSELQSQSNLVCRLLLEKKKANNLHTDDS